MLDRIREICEALPEAQCEIKNGHGIFTVRKKPFAYFLNNHHVDGIIGIACKVLAGDNAALVAAHPQRFYMPAYIASRGWVGLRLDAGKPDWEEVRDLIEGSYQLLAPKTLRKAARLE